MSLCASVGKGEYVANEFHLFAHERSFRRNGTRRLTLVHGGFGSNAFSFWITAGAYIAHDLANDGFPLAMADYSGHDEFGNTLNQTRITQLRALAEPRLDTLTDEVFCLGASMGGLAMANWARSNLTDTRALVLLVPAINPQRLYDEDVGGFASDISTAYGGRPPDDFCPIVNAEDYQGLPMLIYYSTDDPLILPADVLDFGSRAGADVRSMGAVGHQAVLDPGEIAEFLAANQ